MTGEELAAVCSQIGDEVIDLYLKLCEKFPKSLVITGITGAFGSICTEAGFDRHKVISALNSVFDDIEDGEAE